MLTAFNAVAFVLMLAVAYMSWVLGVFRAAMALASCVLAGAVAFGLYGPISAALPGAGNLKSVWYYAGDAVALWGLFCLVFLGLRSLGDRLLREQSALPRLADRAAGAILGLGTGYLAVGMSLISIQMLPLNPDEVLGSYSPFMYDATHNAVVRNPDLWMKWDRGTLAFFDYLSARSLGSEDHAVFGRYGRVYGIKPAAPPEPAKAAGHAETADGTALQAKEAPTADDFLYYHWYRRWEYAWWNTGVSRGPIPDDYPPQPGLGLAPSRVKVLGGVQVQIVKVDTTRRLDFFEQEHLGGDQQFLLVTVMLSPGGPPPVAVDSEQFVLMGPNKDRCAKPLVYDFAKSIDGTPQVVGRTPMPADVSERDLKFSVPDVKRDGRAMASGATFTFKNDKQSTLETFVFVAPRIIRPLDMRLFVEPLSPAPAPPKAAAPKSAGG